MIVLKQLYSRSLFGVCKEKLIQKYKVPADTGVVLQTVAKEQSKVTGRGIFTNGFVS